MQLRNPFLSLTKFEWFLWLGSLSVVTISFFMGENRQGITLIASLVGATALIFVAKGDVVGQILTLVFSLLYAVVSYDLRYYGEMITYLGMTSPIAVLSILAWRKNPYEAGKAEVKISRLSRTQLVAMVVLTVLVTGGFYFILAFFQTNNLFISTVSIATSFLASYLMLFRSPGYALAYAANDMVLITLWVLACMESMAYLPMVACFIIFFINDAYGFFNWQKMMKRQNLPCPAQA